MDGRQLVHHEFQRSARKFRIDILADDLEVPMNVGSLFRIADALGVERLYLTGNSPVPPNRKIRKTSRSTENAVPFEYHVDPCALVRRLRDRGDSIVSLEITDSSVDIRSFRPEPEQRICLIVGSESRGVSDALLALSDSVIHIPMFGQNSSMNVSSACSIAVFQIAREWYP